MSEQKEIKPVALTLADESDDDYDGSDLIEIQLKSNTIQVSFIQLYKHSLLFRQKYLTSESRKYFSAEILQYQNQFNIKENSTILFFKLIQEESINIISDNYRDLCKLSEFFQTKKIAKILDKYSKSYLTEVDTIVFQILESHMVNFIGENYDDKINQELELKLTSQVNNCLKNRHFDKLPISIVYRIISKSDIQKISSDCLLDFILKSVKERYLLFGFLRLETLSDKSFDMLYEKTQNDEIQKFIYQSIPADLKYIKTLKDGIKNLDDQIKTIKSENEKKVEMFQNEISKTKSENEKLKAESDQNKSRNKQLQDEIIKIKNENEKKVEMFQTEISKINGENEKLKAENDQNKSKNKQLQDEIINTKNENEKLKAENDQNKSKIKKLQNEIIKIKNENEKKDELFQNGISKIKSENEKLKTVNDQNKSKNQQLHDEIIEIKNEYEKKVELFQNEISKTKSENEELKAENDQNKSKIKKFQDEIDALKKDANQSNNTKIGKITIQYDPTQEYNGIFNYLKKQFNSKIFDVIDITASSIDDNNNPENVIIYNDRHKYFYSDNEKNSWLSFHFKKHKIIPSSYTIEATKIFVCPISWTIEGSNDSNMWEVITEQNKCYLLEDEKPHTFNINNKQSYRFIRMKMKGKNSSSESFNFIIESFEIYGTLVSL